MADIFQMTIEVEDRVKGSQSELVMSSTITWYDFQQKVAKRLNIFLLKLTLQHRFSNENRSSLPFDLNSHISFGSMCNKLTPFVVSPTLNNGKRFTCKMKLVTVQLFNRDAVGETENHSDGKKSKVSATDIMSTNNLN